MTLGRVSSLLLVGLTTACVSLTLQQQDPCVTTFMHCGAWKHRVKLCPKDSLSTYMDRAFARVGVNITPSNTVLATEGAILTDITQLQHKSRVRCHNKPQNPLPKHPQTLSMQDQRAYAALYNKGNELGFRKGDYLGAVRLYKAALELAPASAGAYTNLGEVLRRAGQTLKSIQALYNVLKLSPSSPTSYNNLAAAISRDDHTDKRAETMFRQAVQLGYGHEKEDFFHSNLVTTLEDRFKMEEMVTAAEAGLSRFPNHPGLATSLCRARVELCDWSHRRDDLARFRYKASPSGQTLGSQPRFYEGTAANLAQIVRFSLSVVRRFAHQYAISTSAQVGGPEAEIHAASIWKVGGGARRSLMARSRRGYRMVVGLVASDWQVLHPVAQSMQGILKHFTRDTFELQGYNTMASKIATLQAGEDIASPHGVPIRSIADMSPQGAVPAIQEAHVAVLVHVNGYTKWGRSDVFALHAAPIQISAIGYELTLDMAAVPYILTDLRSLPPSLAPGYRELLVALPHAYLPNNHRERHAAVWSALHESETDFSQESSVILASNNHNGKLDPSTFTVWCNLLRRSIPTARLRLRALQFHTATMEEQVQGGRWTGRLGAELAARGLPHRSMFFFGRVEPAEDFLSKMAEADLGLDTIAYGGQTTTLDTMGVGIPVLSIPVDSVVARFTYAAMAVSLGDAHLEESVVFSIKAYEDAGFEFTAN